MNKICTTISQSKKLIELGIDIYTADMFWKNGVSDEYIQCFTPFVSTGTNVDFDYDIPAWSLTALLGVLPSATLDSSNDHYYRLRCMERYTEWHDNPIDACYEMVIKLHELKIL